MGELGISKSAKGDESRGLRLLLSVPTGFQQRFFFRSEIVRKLLDAGCELTIASPNDVGTGSSSVFRHPQLKFIKTEMLKYGPLQWRYWGIRELFLTHTAPTTTIRQKLKALRQRNFSLWVIAQLGNFFCQLSPILKKILCRLEYLMARDRQALQMLETGSYDAVVVLCSNFHIQDIKFMHAAKKFQVPVIAGVASWDNLSSRGLVNPLPQKILVWSKFMQKEAVEWHGFSNEQIAVVGAPLYDAYPKISGQHRRAEILKTLGLDPSRKTIFYGTSHAAFVGDEIDAVRDLANWVNTDQLDFPSQLIVRLHPQAVAPGPYQLQLDEYRALESDRVKIDFPEILNVKMQWDLPSGDLDWLVQQLVASDVVVNLCSTISLDASILDRPVVNLWYDPSGPKPARYSNRRYINEAHYQPLVDQRAVTLAESSQHLKEVVNRYLGDPGLHRFERARMVTQFFGNVDGESSARFVAEVLRFLGRNSVLSVKQKYQVRFRNESTRSESATI